jgi:methyl-accepting chemotaxis protein
VAELRHFYKQSITGRLVSMMILALSLILFGALFVLWSTVAIIQDYMQQTNATQDKQQLVSQIADHSNEIILRARGYYVYLSDFEYEQIFAEKESLDTALVEVKKLNLSNAELEVMRNIEDFFNNYFDNLLPQAIEYAEAQNYEELRAFVSAGADNPVNKLILYAHDFEQQVQLMATQQNEELIQDLWTQAYWFIGYILLMLIVFAIITRKLGTDMGAPLRQLTKQARRFAEGERFELESLTRMDEIGELSRSLQKMMGQIHIKEETLIAQNEELQAQQEELQAQQEELQYALSLTEANEQYLKQRNLLVQSLSNTLNEAELLDSIVHHMVEITAADKGLLVMMDDEHAYAAIGVSAAAAEQFIANIDEGITLRAVQTRKAYSVERECTLAEQGYHREPAVATDFVLPIVHGDGAVVACLILTKQNWRISPQEEAEIIGLASQISLSFDKLVLYEQSERQRLMTSDMLNTIQEGIQFLNLNGVTLELNRRMSELFGLSPIEPESGGISLDMFLAYLQERVAEPDELAAHIRSRVAGGYLSYARSRRLRA